jgi:hypothetical protein
VEKEEIFRVKFYYNQNSYANYHYPRVNHTRAFFIVCLHHPCVVYSAVSHRHPHRQCLLYTGLEPPTLQPFAPVLELKLEPIIISDILCFTPGAYCSIPAASDPNC